MSAIFNDEQTQLAIKFLQENQHKFATRRDLVKAALDHAAPPPAKQPLVNSSCIHRWLTTSGIIRAKERNGALPAGISPLDVIHNAEHQIKDAILDLDVERNKLQERIKEIDNIVAKYRTFLA